MKYAERIKITDRIAPSSVFFKKRATEQSLEKDDDAEEIEQTLQPAHTAVLSYYDEQKPNDPAPVAFLRREVFLHRCLRSLTL